MGGASLGPAPTPALWRVGSALQVFARCGSGAPGVVPAELPRHAWLAYRRTSSKKQQRRRRRRQRRRRSRRDVGRCRRVRGGEAAQLKCFKCLCLKRGGAAGHAGSRRVTLGPSGGGAKVGGGAKHSEWDRRQTNRGLTASRLSGPRHDPDWERTGRHWLVGWLRGRGDSNKPLPL